MSKGKRQDSDSEMMQEPSLLLDGKTQAPRLYDVVLDRLVRDGLIAEVRAYHHSDAKNRKGDLVGFDHAGRDHTTLERWDGVRERDGAGPGAADRVRP